MTTNLGARPVPGAGALSGTAVLAHSTPYPWPYDAAFAAARTALLIFTTADPGPSSADRSWPVIEAVAAATARGGGLVIDIESRRPPRRGSMPRGASSSAPRVGTAHYQLESPGWDAFYSTALDLQLRTAGRDLLLLAGAWLEVGVHSTMRSANDRGYECLLVLDACISGSELTAAAARSSIEMSGGIFGAVGTSQDLLGLLGTTQSSSRSLTSEFS